MKAPLRSTLLWRTLVLRPPGSVDVESEARGDPVEPLRDVAEGPWSPAVTGRAGSRAPAPPDAGLLERLLEVNAVVGDDQRHDEVGALGAGRREGPDRSGALAG